MSKKLAAKSSNNSIGINDDLSSVYESQKVSQNHSKLSMIKKPNYIIKRNIKSASRSRQGNEHMKKRRSELYTGSFGVKKKFITKRVW